MGLTERMFNLLKSLLPQGSYGSSIELISIICFTRRSGS